MTIANVNVRQILLKRGNTSQSTGYTGPVGELTLDTDLDTIRVHDGVTAGGVNTLATQAQINTVTSAWTSNASAQSASITAINANIAAANLAIITANTALKDYTDDAISTAISDLITTAPGTLDTLGEIAANLADGGSAVASIINSIALTNANIGAFETYANITFNSIDANLGTATTNIQTIDANLGTATTNIQTIDANIGAFETYANVTFSSIDANAASQAVNIVTLQNQVYANANVEAYLPIYTGNVSAELVKVLGGITSFGASPAPVISGFRSISTTGNYLTGEGNITAAGNLVAARDVLGLNGTFTTAVTARNINADGGNISLNPDFGLIFTQSNAVVTANTQSWTFDTTGVLSFPGTPRITTDSDNFEVQAAEAINFEANTVVNIYTDTSGTTKQWQFGDSGDLSVPGDVQFADGSIITDNLEATGDFGISTASNVGFMLDTNEGTHSWLFGTDGNLTIPGDIHGSVVMSVGPTPSQVGRTVNITPADDAGDKTFGFRIDQYGETFTRAYLQLPTAEVDKQVAAVFPHTNTTAGYIFTQGNNTSDDGMNDAFNIFYNNGDIKITSMGSLGGLYTWKFGDTGNLTAPGNVIFADNYVYSGNTFTSPETNGTLKNFKWEFSDLSSGADTVTLQWNLLDTTFPQWYLTTNSQGNVYVFDGDAKTIGFLDNSINSGTVTFGTAANNGAGGTNDIELTSATGNVYISANTTIWTFDNTGNFTFPGNYTVGQSGSTLLVSAPDTTDGIYLDWASEISFFAGNAGAQNVAQIGTLGGTWIFDNDGQLTAPGNIVTTGNLVFSSTQVQSSAYAGGNGHMMMIDTNRTDTYEANGSADKPFKTFAAAIAAVATLNPTGTVPYTFILMGCEIDEDVDFTPYNFNFITISTTCRSAFNNPVTFGNSALKQLTVRNVEFADTVTVTGDGTANQLNDTSFYNVSFNGAVTVTAANSLAFYEAAFFSTVDFVNVNYVYINAAQFNSDWTITVSDSDPVPANGIAPAQVISLDLIANHVYLVDSSASGFIVFQPQNARMGRSDGTYTIPASCVFNPYNSVLIGTWTNNGTATFRNSVSTNAIANVAPTYNGYMGGTAISISGNVTGGNINTAGQVVATGNITGGNIVTAGNVFGNTAGYAIGYRDIPQVSFTGNATIATTDAGKHFYSTQSTDYVLTVANNASQSFHVGAAITVVNQGTGNITIAQGSGVSLYLAGNATASNRTLSTFGMATVMKVATDTWFVSGVGVA